MLAMWNLSPAHSTCIKVRPCCVMTCLFILRVLSSVMTSVPPQCTSVVSPDWSPGAKAIVSVKSRALHNLFRLSSLSGCKLCSWNANACIPLCLHFVHSCTRRAKSPGDWAPLRLSVMSPSLVLPCIACISRFHCLWVYKKICFVTCNAVHRFSPVFCAMRSSSSWQAEDKSFQRWTPNS